MTNTILLVSQLPRGSSDSIFKKPEDMSLHSRGANAPEALLSRAPLRTEGAGKTGCAPHPRSRVQNVHQESAHEHTGSAEAIRPSLRNGFTAYAGLSSATNSFLPPSSAN
jgi:hypothetical protein